MGYRDGGAISIAQPDVLASQLGLEVEQLTGHRDAFVEDGVVIAPWEVTELVATTAARRSPEPILEHVESEERQAQKEAIHGRYSRSGRRDNDYYFDAETAREMDLEYSKPIREVLRAWCGVEAVERFDELVELRKEIKRVGEVAQRAIQALRGAGHGSQASRLQRELGTPVEMLRTGDQDA